MFSSCPKRIVNGVLYVIHNKNLFEKFLGDTINQVAKPWFNASLRDYSDMYNTLLDVELDIRNGGCLDDWDELAVTAAFNCVIPLCAANESFVFAMAQRNEDELNALMRKRRNERLAAEAQKRAAAALKPVRRSERLRLKREKQRATA